MMKNTESIAGKCENGRCLKDEVKKLQIRQHVLYSGAVNQ